MLCHRNDTKVFHQHLKMPEGNGTMVPKLWQKTNLALDLYTQEKSSQVWDQIKVVFVIWRDSESLHHKLLLENTRTRMHTHTHTHTHKTSLCISARQILKPWTTVKPDKQWRVFPEWQVGSKQQISPWTLGQLNGFKKIPDDTSIRA